MLQTVIKSSYHFTTVQGISTEFEIFAKINFNLKPCMIVTAALNHNFATFKAVTVTVASATLVQRLSREQ